MIFRNGIVRSILTTNISFGFFDLHIMWQEKAKPVSRNFHRQRRWASKMFESET